jgi:hypothetical protein
VLPNNSKPYVLVFVIQHLFIDAEVEPFAAGSLEAGGLPGYPKVLVSLK